MLGLAVKAGKAVSGEFSTEKTVKEGRAKLVLIAGDSSENTKKKFSQMCEYYHVPFFIISDKEALGRAMGKEQRACLAVEDEGLANAIRGKM